jgi:RNAse (barnase) inhibitor barstar
MVQEDDRRGLIAAVDVSDVSSIRELHERLAETLEFADFYGKNWDAFWDAITGLVGMPRRLVITGWSTVASRWPKDAQIMLDCLRELNEQHPTWTCEVELHSEAARLRRNPPMQCTELADKLLVAQKPTVLGH